MAMFQTGKAVLRVLVLLCIACVSPVGLAFAQGVPSGQDVVIDIPANLKTAKVLFDATHASFSGDVPVVLKYMDLMLDKFAVDGTKSTIVGVFYGDAAYWVLGDALYNTRRNVTTGNPYKPMIERLQARGVQFEICAQAMREQDIRNKDLLPKVLVNEGANLRMVKLMQEGYGRLQP